MAHSLPVSFEAKMKSLLGDDYESFRQSYHHSPQAGIRVNTLKISAASFKEQSPFALRPIPWCETGFYLEEGTRPGLHPYYHAGLYYIQEPSAMAPVELLGVEPGDRVLDLCAAPGGKSTQIAAKLAGSGHLVTNDIHPDRTKALAKNIELYGVRNAVVLNESPERIAGAFPGYFNKILIDAPCSGEGMFRKDEDMLKHWKEDSPLQYAGMQRDILASAALMLEPGGTIVYSTCTFSPEENEGMIAVFLKEHEDFTMVSEKDAASPWFSRGESAWLLQHGLPEAGLDPVQDDAYIAAAAESRRIWPHRVEGEGHFMAVLRKKEIPGGSQRDDSNAIERHLKEQVKPKKDRRGKKGVSRVQSRDERNPRGKQSDIDGAALLQDFIEQYLHLDLGGDHVIMHGQHLYRSPVPEERLKGLKIVRAGWYLGQVKNGRFVPSHPLAAALHPQEASQVVNLSSSNGEAVRYLKGETLEIGHDRVKRGAGSEVVQQPKGYVLVCIDGYAAGWGKWQSGMLKNEYPAAWRWTSV
ncbi:RsmB/NOP family class I SAM-dependent RNA methyltransferase [Paenibacillus lemnae]|uniref:rRNA cytosine-C5-methyltransferase n=1 Tax=Paenibacillus lemnae TaxID=1330551 RepID=A0A848M3K3_PAELE|nr:RsmB/NOP family class I SAM-dependent RNA methyltransferase [Paenibacillus lemnae]NMO95355.1 rRNA cytosine-C5-methyltransferase [Paenibacillus lemnae]